MPSAVDIITYIGIPLAVLGVLPTIYTCLKSYLTLRAISKSLSTNSVTAITRSSLLSGIVEIEIPRRSIIPLDRNDPGYFPLRSKRSNLKGGSWTVFNWKEMVIGVKSYRLQYHDELVQPQAEIEFEALVAFLLDRGAWPVKEGWADLRSAGLWTPAGTRLLAGPAGFGEETALWVSVSDDSDGSLSLAMLWRDEWGGRDGDGVPPYWVKVRAPLEGEDILKAMNNKVGVQQDEDKADTRNANFLLDDASSTASSLQPSKSALRIRIGPSGLQEAHQEDSPKKTLLLPHLFPKADHTTGFWFSCASTAFVAPRKTLWSFIIPLDILALVRRESVPCGVMVLLSIMTDEEVPTWRTPHDYQSEQFEKHVKFMDQSRRIQEEMRLPPGEREAAQKKRMEQQAVDFHNDFRRKRMREEQRKEQEIVEAMQSQKLPIETVANANSRWIQSYLNLSPPITIVAIVEQILFYMVQDVSLANRIAKMLDLWKSWSQSGGMTKGHYLAVREDQVAFALASFVLYIIRGIVEEPTGSSSLIGDLQECLRLWKRVRLG